MKRRSFFQATLVAIALGASAASASLRAAVFKVCSKGKLRPRAIKLPPLPRWNAATDDIDSGDFVRRVHDYERALLRSDVAFPRVGQVWEARHDCEVNYLAWCTVEGRQALFLQPAAPIAKQLQLPLRGGQVRLQQGERVRIQALDDPDKPLQVTFVPLRYDSILKFIVKEVDYRRVSHYVLTLRTAYTMCCSRDEQRFFHELFRPAEDVA